MSKNYELLQRVSTTGHFPLSVETASHSRIAPAPLGQRRVAADPEIGKLVQRLFSAAGQDNGPKVVSFSGIARDDRSSWICARAAEILSEQAGSSVCVVDANLVAPQLHVELAAASHPGFADALITKEPIRNYATPISGEHLWLIPAGHAKPGFRPSRERYRERMAELREAFEYILVGAPSLARETEATLFGQLADGAVLIVEANRTRRETLRRAKEQLQSAHVTLLGAVLDQRTFPIPEKLYHRL